LNPGFHRLTGVLLSQEKLFRSSYRRGLWPRL